MNYIFNETFIRNHQILFIVSTIITLLIIVGLIIVGIKVIKKK